MRCKDWFVDFQPMRASHFARLGLRPDRSQRCLPCRLVGFQEPVEEGLPVVAEQRRQAAKGHVVGLFASRCDETPQACHARPDDLFAVEFFARQMQQQGGLVMLEGALEQPGPLLSESQHPAKGGPHVPRLPFSYFRVVSSVLFTPDLSLCPYNPTPLVSCTYMGNPC